MRWLSLLCLRFAQVASFLGVAVVLFGSICSLFDADFLLALMGLLILTPVSIGGFVSFGLIIRYAKGE